MEDEGCVTLSQIIKCLDLCVFVVSHQCAFVSIGLASTKPIELFVFLGHVPQFKLTFGAWISPER